MMISLGGAESTISIEINFNKNHLSVPNKPCTVADMRFLIYAACRLSLESI